MPLRELCNGLGAEIKWDDNTKSATVKYRSAEYVFTVGKPSYVKDGVQDTRQQAAPFIDEQGHMVIPFGIDDDMGINCHIYTLDEDDNINRYQNAKWHIIP